MAVDPSDFRAALGQWPSGVTVVTTTDGEQPLGMTASSFSSVSLDPPLISVCVARRVRTHDPLIAAGHFAVSILAKDQVHEGERFAGMHGVEDRFAGIATTTAVTGAPVLTESLAWLDCSIWAVYDGGDHSIVVGQVEQASTRDDAAPLLYHDRAWGQFADVLASKVAVLEGAPAGWAEITDAWGNGTARSVDELVEVVRAQLATEPAGILLRDDASAADPLLVRRSLQAVGNLCGPTPVAVAFGAGPLMAANLVVALKSGIDRVLPVPGTSDDVLMLLDRMEVELAGPTPAEG